MNAPIRLTDRTWEEETLDLIGEARKEERKAEQRVASAQRALEAARANRVALERVLSLYRQYYGIVESADAIDPEIAAGFKGLSLKAMLDRWADVNEGRIIMNDISAFLTSLGLFQSKKQATGALYSTAQRSADYERAQRGVFQRIKEQEQEAV